jgi:putative phosphoesterase
MRLAVLADTHDRFPKKLPGLLAAADEIWHLGDVCEPEVLAELESLGPPLRVVRGNNDFYPGWPLTLRREIAGVRFHLEHIPPARVPPDCDVILHGHTHVPRDELLHGRRWLNPGCVSYANRGAPASFAWLTVDENRPLAWSLVLL